VSSTKGIESRTPLATAPTNESDSILHRRVTRREFGAGAAALGLSASFLPTILSACGSSQPTASTGSKTVVWRDGGGSYGDALKSSFFDPFTKKTGITVEFVPVGGADETAFLKNQVQSGSVNFDVDEVYGNAVSQLVDYLEPLDYSVIGTSNSPADARSKYAIRSAEWIFVMAWNETKVSQAQIPTSWADWWDSSRVRPPRSIYNVIGDTHILEAAVLADGVALDKVFPLDVTRAIKMLDRLGAKNIVWASSSAQSIAQLTSGEAPMGTSFNGRVLIARNQNHAPLNFSTNQAIVDGGWFVIPKGAPHKDAAMKLLQFMYTDPTAGAQFITTINYDFPNIAAHSLLPAGVADQLPNSPKLQGKIAYTDNNWWAANYDAVAKRFQVWITTGVDPG
jgi:putative spermidine/putrescine transport system substrate-binding protein